MDNSVGKTLEKLGSVAIIGGFIGGIAMWIIIGISYSGLIGFAAALVVIGSSFISGMMFNGFAEIIFLLQGCYNKISVIEASNDVAKKPFEIIETSEKYEGQNTCIFRVYCGDKFYDYKFVESFRKRCTIDEFINTFKKNNFKDAAPYLEKLRSNDELIKFIEKD